VEREADDLDSEHESRPRDWRLWLRAVALTIFVGALLASLVLEGDARHFSQIVFLSGAVLAELVMTARDWRGASFEQRCRRLGAVAFFVAWLMYVALDAEIPTVAMLVACVAYALLLCVDMYRSLEAARPSYGSPPVRARRGGVRTNFPGAPATDAARRSP
jgi:hypothetical protein